MPPGAESDQVWDNDWDDTESTTGGGALESQQILRDQDEEEIEDEIRDNLSHKISSSLHAYKIASIALLITLVSFTINTVDYPLVENG